MNQDCPAERPLLDGTSPTGLHGSAIRRHQRTFHTHENECLKLASVRACDLDAWEAQKQGNYKFKVSLVKTKLAQTQRESNQMNNAPLPQAQAPSFTWEATSHTRLGGSYPTSSHTPQNQALPRPQATFIPILICLFEIGFLCAPGCRGIRFINQVGFKLTEMCPLLPPKCWD